VTDSFHTTPTDAWNAGMIGDQYAEALEEFGRLLNDPDVPIQPEVVWDLLDQVIKAGYVARDRVNDEGQA
jgi:hypothetical protein